ncbi:MAG: hypothetical protein ACN6OP_10075, partial [Pseudomonadales bacterium]
EANSGREIAGAWRASVGGLSGFAVGSVKDSVMSPAGQASPKWSVRLPDPSVARMGGTSAPPSGHL